MVAGLTNDGMMMQNKIYVGNRLMNPKTAMLDVDGTANITGALAAGNTTITGSITATTYVGITPEMVTLGNVNNTSDALKPISTATNTALNLKADQSSPTI